MATYNDLFIRSNLSDTGTIPRQGTQSHCPDIIPYGVQPVNDPTTTFTNNYNKDVGKDIQINAQNYLYLRAKNLKDGPQTGTVNLYYATSNIILYPAQWRNNILKTSDGSTDVPVSAAATNDIVVTNNPFTWVPQQPPSGTHYCLIGAVGTAQNPNPIPNITAIDGMAQWVAQNGGIGWRNVATTTKDTPTFTTTVPYDQGDKPYKVKFLIECYNVPMGSSVSFSAGTPTSGQPIFLPKTEVNTYPSFEAGMTTDVPADYKTNIAYSWFRKDQNLPSDATITISAYVVSNGKDVIAKLGHTVHQLGLGNAWIYTYDKGMVRAAAATGPQKLISVGGFTTKPA